MFDDLKDEWSALLGLLKERNIPEVVQRLEHARNEDLQERILDALPYYLDGAHSDLIVATLKAATSWKCSPSLQRVAREDYDAVLFLKGHTADVDFLCAAAADPKTCASIGCYLQHFLEALPQSTAVLSAITRIKESKRPIAELAARMMGDDDAVRDYNGESLSTVAASDGASPDTVDWGTDVVFVVPSLDRADLTEPAWWKVRIVRQIPRDGVPLVNESPEMREMALLIGNDMLRQFLDGWKISNRNATTDTIEFFCSPKLMATAAAYMLRSNFEVRIEPIESESV